MIEGKRRGFFGLSKNCKWTAGAQPRANAPETPERNGPRRNPAGFPAASTLHCVRATGPPVDFGPAAAERAWPTVLAGDGDLVADGGMLHATSIVRFTALEDTMATIAIAYATRKGHTLKVAEYLATAIRVAGHHVRLLDTDGPPRTLHLDQVDAVIVAAPIHGGKYPASIVRFAGAHSRELGRIPNAFCSIGLTVASRTTNGRAQTQPIVDAFQRKTGWRPGRTELVAGALKYTRYNFIIRFVMRRIAAANGGDVDTSRDYEYTDWEALDRVAAQMCRDAAQHAAARVVPPDLAVAGHAVQRT